MLPDCCRGFGDNVAGVDRTLDVKTEPGVLERETVFRKEL